MMKGSIFILIALVSVTGCAHVQPKEKLHAVIERTEKLEQQEVFESEPVTSEDTHELVEAKADDKEIETTVGSKEIDEELAEPPKIELPNEKIPFLKKRNSRRMQFWVNYFTEKDRARFQRFINNGEEYRHHIEEIFESYGLPKELYFVGLIESGYYLGAKSHASAVGPWQFITGTGKRYGLKISQDIDERRDLFKATHAAARYLKDLYNVFSSWELALSGYNAGEFGILRRIMKYKTRDFYELSRRKFLPSETINYVPKVLAAMHIFSNAEKYGFNLPKKDNRIFDETELRPIRKNLSLRKISHQLKIKLALLKKLNPELKRGKTPRFYSGTYQIRIPRGLGSLLNAPDFRHSRRDVIRRTAKNTHHRVRRGETLLQLARKYSTSAGNLARLNNLNSWRSKLRVGQRIVVSGKAAKIKKVANYRPITYKVRRGDNLSSLANLFGISQSKIVKENNLRSKRIYVGQKIILPNTKRGVYTVRPGDHLSKIARKFNQPVPVLQKINALRKNIIFAGQKIIVDID